MKHFTQVRKPNRVYSLVIILLTVLSACVLGFLIREYAARFRSTFSSETQAYMHEIAEQATVVMNDRVEMNVHNLETIAVAIAQLQSTDRAKAALFLEGEAKRYGYSGLSIAGADGIALGNDGASYNVSTRKHFLSALRGESAVSGVITSDFNNTDSIEFAVPIRRDDAVSGVLLAGYNLCDFGDILQVHMFDGRGSALVIDGDGVVIVNNGTQEAYNFYYFLQDSSVVDSGALTRFKSNIASGSDGMLSYTHEENGYLLHYQPLGINDWSLLVCAPADSITQKTNLFIRGTTYIGIAIAALVALLMLILVLLQYRNRKTLERLLYVDSITGGASQAKFEEDARLRIAKKEIGTYAMVQMNIEKFKLINTTFGRKSGDDLLCYVHAALHAQLGADELVARFSADRFCMLLHYHSQQALTMRLCEMCNKINSFNDGLKNKYVLQFSAGICVVDDACPDISVLYERANFARTRGGSLNARTGSVTFYDDLERGVIMREKEIENRMEDALAQGEFKIFLQPKYDLADNTVAGAEALARWDDPERGLVFPNDFIPLFERNGFIVKLDLYIFEQVCALLQRWYDEGGKCVPISVNLSRVHLEHPDFLDRYREIYSRFTFPPCLLEIELTESIVFDNMERLCSVIEEIHAVGFECSMDDFGSGYSSLNMLKDIPVDTLKLDRAFFYSRTGDETKSRFVIENVINLAQKLSMKTVSEGVETLEQVEHLRRANCQMVQGYVFAKPMPVSNFERLMK